MRDNDIFHELIVSNNEEVIKMMKEIDKDIIEKKEQTTEDFSIESEEQEEKVNVEHELYKIDEFTGLFNSMTMDYENGLTEERYKYLLQQMSGILSGLKKALPYMKTQEEIIAEQSKFSMFDDFPSNVESSEQISDFGDDIDWDFPPLDEKQGKTM